MENFKEKYYSLLNNYFLKKDEASLFEASELGRELVKRNLSAEDVAEIHEYAIQQLGKEFPELKLTETVPYISAPLLEMLMAYGLTFRKLLEQSQKVEQDLINDQKKLESLVEERTAEIDEKNKKLSDQIKVFVGRELKIRDLEKKIRLMEGESR